MKIKEICGYDDFLFNAWFELGGFSGQPRPRTRCAAFAEEVMPVLRRECGGSPAEVRERPSQLVPDGRRPVPASERGDHDEHEHRAGSTMASAQSDYLKDLYRPGPSGWPPSPGHGARRPAGHVRGVAPAHRRADRRDLRGGRRRRRPRHRRARPTARRGPGRSSGRTAAATSWARCTATARWPATWPRPPASRALGDRLPAGAGAPPPRPGRGRGGRATAGCWTRASPRSTSPPPATRPAAGCARRWCCGLRDEGHPLPAAIMPMSPWYDMEAQGRVDRRPTPTRTCWSSGTMLLGMATMFLGGQPRRRTRWPTRSTPTPPACRRC